MSSYLETAIEIAREASDLVRDFAGRHIGFELKGEHDLVTAADRASEKLIVDRLRAAFPSHSIVAEEGGGHTGSSEFRWYVDPLDGTTNFAHGFPAYNVTLALEQAGELVAGVIADPARDEVFSAERGSGAYLNGEKIQVSKVNRIEDALVATGFPSRRRHQNVNVHFFYQLSMLSHGVRRPGAAALDLAYVACGRLDGFWEMGLSSWDVAAGSLLVTEAGGVVTDFHGRGGFIETGDIIAAGPAIHPEMLAIVREAYGR